MATAPNRSPTLRAVQRWMAAQIVSGTQPGTLTPAADDLDALLHVPPRGDVAERVRVYSAGYPARVQEALEEAFPAVAHIVGAGAFAGLARRYADAIPLSSYNLNDAGTELPPFLRKDRLTESLPFLPDLAQLEWLVLRAFHAPEQPAFDPAVTVDWTLADWDGAVLRFQPWVGLVTADAPIREIWTCRDTPIAEIEVDLCNRPDRVLVRRSGYAVVCESVGVLEAAALRALLEGQALGVVTAALTGRGEDPASVSACFTRWMALRMITDCVRQADA